jgi:hypothetical protein
MFPADQSKPVEVLPQLLSESTVLAALARL